MGGTLDGPTGFFYYYEGTSRITLTRKVINRPFIGGEKGSVIEAAGEFLVNGRHWPILSGSPAMGRCGYAGVSHMMYTIDSLPRDIYMEQCLLQHPYARQHCQVTPPEDPLPTLPKCT